jgi:signal recognition particle subunit SRP72
MTWLTTPALAARRAGCQTEQCRELLGALAVRFPDSESACLLNAALHVREKRAAKAEEVLTVFAPSQQSGASARVRLMRAQLSAVLGDVPRTLAALGELSEALRFAPRLVATCVALHESQGAPERGEELLDAALAFWDAAARRSGDADAANRAACVARASAEFKQRHGRHAEAVALYERLLQGATTEEARARARAGLVLACAHTDLSAAERHAALLAAPTDVASDLDAEDLETGVAWGRHAGASEPAAADSRKREAGADAQPSSEQRARKRRARKPRYPKGFDPLAPNNPPPDPERWLPRRERAAFKGKRRTKAQQLRGAQGATPAAAAAAASPTPAPSAPPSDSKGKGKKGGGRR